MSLRGENKNTPHKKRRFILAIGVLVLILAVASLVILLNNGEAEEFPVEITPRTTTIVIDGSKIKTDGITLDLSETSISDLSVMSNLTGLRELDLSQTQITDLTPLESLEGLEVLNIGYTAINDLLPLDRLTNFEFLSVSETKMDRFDKAAILQWF